MLTEELVEFLIDHMNNFKQHIDKTKSILSKNTTDIHDLTRFHEMVEVHQKLIKMKNNKDDFENQFKLYCAERTLEINNTVLDFNASETYSNQLIKSIIKFLFKPLSVKSLLSITHPHVTEQIELVSVDELNETQQKKLIQENSTKLKTIDLIVSKRLFVITNPLSEEESSTTGMDFLDNLLVIGNQCFDVRQLLHSNDIAHDIEKYRALATYTPQFLIVYEAYASLRTLKNQILIFYGSGQTIGEALFLLHDGFKKGGIKGRGSEEEADLIAVRAYEFWECFKKAVEQNNPLLYKQMMQLKNNEGKTLEKQLNQLLSKKTENISCVDLASDFFDYLLKDKNNASILNQKLIYETGLDTYEPQTELYSSLVIKIPSRYFSRLIKQKTSIDSLMKVLSFVLSETEYDLISNQYQKNITDFGKLLSCLSAFKLNTTLLHKQQLLAPIIDFLTKILPLKSTYLWGEFIDTLPNIHYIKQIANYYFDKNHDELAGINKIRSKIVIRLLKKDENKLLLFFELVKKLDLEATISVIDECLDIASLDNTLEKQLAASLEHLISLDINYDFLNQLNFLQIILNAANQNTLKLAVIFYDFFKTYDLCELSTLDSVENTNDFSDEVNIQWKNEVLIGFMLRDCADEQVITLLEWGGDFTRHLWRFRLIFALLSSSSFYSEMRKKLISDSLFIMISNVSNSEKLFSIILFAPNSFIFEIFAHEKTPIEHIVYLINLGTQLSMLGEETLKTCINPLNVLLKNKEVSQKVLDRLFDKDQKEYLESSLDYCIFLAFLIVRHQSHEDWRYEIAKSYIEDKLKFIAEHDKEYGGTEGVGLISSLTSLIIDKNFEIKSEIYDNSFDDDEELINKLDDVLVALSSFLMNKQLTEEIETILLTLGDYSDLIITLVYRFKTVSMVVDDIEPSSTYWFRWVNASRPVRKDELIRVSDLTIQKFLLLYPDASEEMKKNIFDAVVLLAKMPHRVESFLKNNPLIPKEITDLLCATMINECNTSLITQKKVKQSLFLRDTLLQYEPEGFKSLFNEAVDKNSNEEWHNTIQTLSLSQSDLTIFAKKPEQKIDDTNQNPSNII